MESLEKQEGWVCLEGGAASFARRLVGWQAPPPSMKGQQRTQCEIQFFLLGNLQFKYRTVRNITLRWVVFRVQER